MRRRDLLGGTLAAAALMPFGSRAQQKALPVVGYLSSRSLSDSQDIIAAFHQGLSEAGFVDKRPGRLLGAQPDDPARHAGVAAHRLIDSDSCRSHAQQLICAPTPH